MFSIICYSSIISVVFAFNMSIYSGSNYYNIGNRIRFRKLVTKYNFSYQPNDKLMMDVILMNAAPGVTGTAFITQRLASNEATGDTRMKNTTNCSGGLCLSMRHIILNTPSILIGLQLNQASTTCWTAIFMEGNQTLSTPASKALCVEPDFCVIKIDLQNACHDVTKSTSPYITSVTTDTPKMSHNTSNTVEHKINDTDIKKYIAITVASAVSIIALILLVVVLRKRCWIKHNPIDSSQLPAHDPFYVNMLFRKECDREIELVEQHVYEEINPQ